MSDALVAADWEVRTEIYRQIIESRRAPAVHQIAASLDFGESDVEASLLRLETHHHLVLAPGGTRIWMAHPFSAIPTDYPVETEKGRYWSNCAWDSLGIPAVIGCDSRTRTRCAESGVPIEYGVRDGDLVVADCVIHFAVPARQWYDNVAFT